MYIPERAIKALRYLCVLRINKSLARMPVNFGFDMAYIMAHLISEKLSTRLAKPWVKLLDSYHSEYLQNQKFPHSIWPLDIAILKFPSKNTFGMGELVMFELKLFGESASHENFLELILPAMEDMSSKKDSRWYSQNAMWGAFDIDAIYVCDGDRWHPLVMDGDLNLNYRPTPWQWARKYQDRLDEKVNRRYYRHIVWLNNFDLSPITCGTDELSSDSARSLHCVIEAMINRMNYLLEVSENSRLDIWDFFTQDAANHLMSALNDSRSIVHGRHDLSSVSTKSPGKWKGSQHFVQKIPDVFIPYLDLASILHIGKYTQYGCGSFILE